MRTAIFILVCLICMVAGLIVMNVHGCEHTGVVICATSATVIIALLMLHNGDI